MGSKNIHKFDQTEQNQSKSTKWIKLKLFIWNSYLFSFIQTKKILFLPSGRQSMQIIAYAEPLSDSVRVTNLKCIVCSRSRPSTSFTQRSRRHASKIFQNHCHSALTSMYSESGSNECIHRHCSVTRYRFNLIYSMLI